MADGNGKADHLAARRIGRGVRPSAASLSNLYDEVLDAVIDIAGADKGVLYRLDDEYDCLRIVASQGYPDHLLKYFEAVRRDSNSTCAAALRERVRVIVDDVSTSPFFHDSSALDAMREMGVGAAHSTPIIGASGRLWGVFTAHFESPQPPEGYDPRMLEQVAVEFADCLDRFPGQAAEMEDPRASTRRHKSFRLAGSIQQCPCHACAFFTSKEEEYRVMLPFMAEGFEAGDKLFHIIDGRRRDERLAKLGSAGIDVGLAEQRGQLELVAWEQAHVVGGRFDQDRMLAGLEQQAMDGDDRFPTMRLWSNQEWALEKLPGVEDIVEYEARFNYIWPKTNSVYVCVFDATKFSPETLTQVMRTHPMVIIDGIMFKNEFYVPPDEFLKEIRGS